MTTYRVPVLDDFSWQPPVKDKDLTTPPGGEAKGDRYIVGGSASGDWSGLDNHIVTYDGAAWIDNTPVEGWTCWIDDENDFYYFDGSSWNLDDTAALEGDITSIDTRVSNTESSVGSIDTRVSVNESTNVVQSTGISTNVVAIASNALIGDSNASSVISNALIGDSNASSVISNALIGDSNASSVVSIDTRATNIESSVGSINTAKQDKGTYVSEYGAIEFTV